MTTFAYLLLLAALFFALIGAFVTTLPLWKSSSDGSKMLSLAELCNAAQTAALSLASAILLLALWNQDFSIEYVASYTDRTLPLFYRLTAFWAGQAGSLLFWALMVAICGIFFQTSKNYRSLSPSTKLWYQLFFLAIMAFFGLLLCAWSNPFLQTHPIPADGRGLNPLLQNPGMIIHPPLLFLGYGGFVIPGCLALAQAMNPAEEIRWFRCTRNYTLFAWLFLTAGIVLGGWWAYMELGWGGYWAWDPVENASIIPWFLGTAAIHIGILDAKRKKASRLHIFFMALTTISAFFATWLVRGNVVNSVHSFGEGGVGPALLTFVLAGTFLVFFISLMSKKSERELGGLETREGFLIMTAVMLTTLSLIILVATLWPVISKLWTESSVGLDATFYNRVCLPLFTVILALLSFCPWLGWDGGVRKWSRLAIVALSIPVALGLFWTLGYSSALPLISAALCVSTLLSMALLIQDRSSSLSSIFVHVGFVLIALGIAFSGPYKQEKEVTLAKGEKVEVGPYTVELAELYEGSGDRYHFLEAELNIFSGDKKITVVAPQRRIYNKFGNNAYAEAATYPSLGSEFYATLLGLDEQQRAVMRLSSNPLVNWLWIGGIIMTFAPFLGMRRRKKENEGV